MTSSSPSSMELVFVPTPGMGHLLSAVNMAKRIVHRDERLSIFVLIINLPSSSSNTKTFLESQSRENPHPTRLNFLTLPPLSHPPGPSTPNFFQTLIELQKPLVKQAIEDRIRTGSPTLSGLVLDMFCTTMMDIADEFNVPSYVFFTSGANLLNLMFYLQPLGDDQGVDIATKFSDPDVELDVPGFRNRLLGKNLPSAVVHKQMGTPMMLNIARNLRKSKGILVNTYMELESYGLQALFDLVAKDSIPKVYPLGPILELDNESRSGSQGEIQESIIIEWLNDQPLSSVVFLCFGSRGTFDADQVKEMAKGLEKSGHRFLWSLRTPPQEARLALPSENEIFLEALPEGFLDRTSDLGKVIGWAPQVSILSHPAIGGFVSHCGWNSTLESMWFGVPMATWPIQAEQQLNAFGLVKELGLAVEIRMDYRRDWKTGTPNFLVSAEDIENGVKKLMGLDETTKKSLRQISDNSRNTLSEGGISHEWLGSFIKDVLVNVG